MRDTDVTLRTVPLSDAPTEAVVAGLDGTDRDLPVVDWAAARAARSGAVLHLVHARSMLADLSSMGGMPLEAAAVSELEAEDGSAEVLRRASDRARAADPDLEVVLSAPWGTGSQSLIEAGARARLVVVGSEQKGGLARAVLGTTSLAVAMHSVCPVVVVSDRAQDHRDGPVLVGVDGSDDSAAALEAAMLEAELLGIGVEVLSTWHLEVVDGQVVTSPENPHYAAVEDRLRARAEQVCRAARDRHPDVPLTITVRRAAPKSGLVEASAQARLVVVGSRGLGGFAGRLLGSVSHHVMQAAACPVMVVRTARG